MEEFIHAEVNSYDAIINAEGEPIFETGNVTPWSIMDIVNDNDNSIYYILKDLPEDTRQAGRATVKALGSRAALFTSSFPLNAGSARHGPQGDVVALEVNMRPCGGFTPDMMNFAHSTDVYKIWADMIAFDHSTKSEGPHAFCAFAGRRDGKSFALSDDELIGKYASQMRMVTRIPDALSGAMGNRMFLAVFPTKEEMDAFYFDALRCQ